MKQRLFALQDAGYRAFQCKLIPNIDPDTVIGVRVPQLRGLAKQLEISELGPLPHAYYEQNMLHAFIINKLRDFDACMAQLEQFLPYVDNWAVCDGLRPKCIKKNRQAFLPHIRRWLTSLHPYTVRFAIEMLMVHYLTDGFNPAYPEMVSAIDSNDYYVNMMVAWYFASALAAQYDAVISYLEDGKLSGWVHNKTVQKSIESYRITESQKAYLRTLRKKECT